MTEEETDNICDQLKRLPAILDGELFGSVRREFMQDDIDFFDAVDIIQ